MIFASTLSDIAEVVAAGAALVAAAIAWSGRRISREVRAEVKTMNGLSLAQMGDATETRRIDDIERDERTEGEQQHLDAEPRTDDRP